MEKDKKKIREPFKPHDTPQPPKIIDPDNIDERKAPVKDERAHRQESKASADETKSSTGKEGKSHLLGDEAEIDDETTI